MFASVIASGLVAGSLLLAPPEPSLVSSRPLTDASGQGELFPPLPAYLDITQLQRARSRHTVLAGMGFSVFAGGYLGALFWGSFELDYGTDTSSGGDDDLYPSKSRSSTKAGRRLMIPFVGPFLAIPHLPDATSGLLAATNALSQMGGMAFGIVHAIKLRDTQRRIQLHYGPLVSGGSIQACMRF